MKQYKQFAHLPKLNTNVPNIISQIRVYLKDRHNLTSITSKNCQSHQNSCILDNNNSLSHIKGVRQEIALMQYYKRLRQIEAPYKCIVQNQRMLTQEAVSANHLHHAQSHSAGKQKRQNYFRKRQKINQSIDNKQKKSELMMVMIQNRKQSKNTKQLSYCINLMSKALSRYSKQEKTKRNGGESMERYINSKNLRKKPRTFLREIKKSQRQSTKLYPYQPWQSLEQENDIFYE